MNALLQPQFVRLLDVTIAGPFMLWLASHPRALTRNERLLLGILGAATVGYNLMRYFQTQRTVADYFQEQKQSDDAAQILNP